MATQTKSAPKKAATKKAATKKAEPAKKAATKKAEPAKKTATATAKPAEKKSSDNLKKVDAPLTKEEQFEALGVPKEKRGENLHEQNPDLQASITRNRMAQEQNVQAKALETTVTGERN